MDKSREQSIDDGANMSAGGVNFNYVDTAKLDRLGIGRYSTKKPKGENFMRIVAPNTKGSFAREIWIHPNVGANNATFLCLDMMFGKVCPICEHAAELKRSGAGSDVLKELYPSHRFLLFVVDTTSQETEEEGPKWFDCPVTIYKEVCTRSKNRRTGEKIDPTDPKNGRDVEFVRNDGKRTSYTGVQLVEAKPIPKCWYEDLPSFEEVLLIPDPDEMEAAVLGKKSPASKESKADEKDVKVDADEPESRRSRSRSDEESSGRGRGEGSRSRRDDSDDAQAESVKKKLDEIKSRHRARDSE